MSSEFDTSLPSIRLIQSYVKEKATIELRLIDGSAMMGQLLWFDPLFLCLREAGDRQILVRREAIATLNAQ